MILKGFEFEEGATQCSERGRANNRKKGPWIRFKGWAPVQRLLCGNTCRPLLSSVDRPYKLVQLGKYTFGRILYSANWQRTKCTRFVGAHSVPCQSARGMQVCIWMHQFVFLLSSKTCLFPCFCRPVFVRFP